MTSRGFLYSLRITAPSVNVNILMISWSAVLSLGVRVKKGLGGGGLKDGVTHPCVLTFDTLRIDLSWNKQAAVCHSGRVCAL